MVFTTIKYELLTLEEMIEVELSPDNISQPVATIQLKKWKNFFLEECKRIRIGIVRQVLSLSKSKHVEFYIQQHQSAMIKISDMLLRYETGLKQPIYKALRILFREMNEAILELINYLLHYFEAFFDSLHPIPLLLKKKAAGEFSICKEKLDPYRVDDDNRLLNLLLQPIAAISKGQLSNLNFHQLAYFRRYIHSLEKHFNRSSNRRNPLALLMKLNFNDDAAIHYCALFLTRELQEAEDAGSQLRLLAKYTKQLKQIIHLEGKPYNPQKISIIGYCLQWISEEYQYIKNNLLYRQPKPAEGETVATEYQKVETNFSVSELGVFLQLLKREGLIKSRNQTAMIRFFASHFVTRNKEAISAKNLRNCYYNLDGKAVIDLQDKLYALLKTIKTLE